MWRYVHYVRVFLIFVSCFCRRLHSLNTGQYCSYLRFTVIKFRLYVCFSRLLVWLYHNNKPLCFCCCFACIQTLLCSVSVDRFVEIREKENLSARGQSLTSLAVQELPWSFWGFDRKNEQTIIQSSFPKSRP